MFRRKEENALDPSAPGASASAPSAENAHSEAPAPHASAQSSLNVGSGAGGGTYVPMAAPSRPAQEAPRSPAPSASSYRPTPIAEFNRGGQRSATEALRSSSSASAGSSFGAAEKASAPKSNRRVLTVGNDILLKGEIATCDRLVIEGRVEAKLSDVHTVEIAEVGSFKGTAEVEDAEISGVFEGDLIVRNRLVIYSSGEVRGNISYGEIEIERGGRLTGQIKTGSTAAQAAKSKPFETQPADKRKDTVAA